MGKRSTKRRAPRRIDFALFGAATLALAGGATWGFARFAYRQALQETRQLVEKGFGALAVERIDPYRKRAVKDAEGCELALTVYYSAKQAERLAWASEACMAAKVETVKTLLGLALSRELKGNDREALDLLAQAQTRYEKSPDFPYRMAVIFRRLNQKPEATAAYLRAIENAPQNAPLALEALDYFAKQENWNEAGKLASRLKSVETDDPETKLLIARALQRSGDSATAQAVVADARALMSRKPASAAALESAYSDVLVSTPPPPPASPLPQP